MMVDILDNEIRAPAAKMIVEVAKTRMMRSEMANNAAVLAGDS